MDSLKYYICSMHQDFFMPWVLIFSYNGFLIPSTHEEKLISLVLTDGVHLVKEKSSIALNHFFQLNTPGRMKGIWSKPEAYNSIMEEWFAPGSWKA